MKKKTFQLKGSYKININKFGLNGIIDNISLESMHRYNIWAIGSEDLNKIEGFAVTRIPKSQYLTISNGSKGAIATINGVDNAKYFSIDARVRINNNTNTEWNYARIIEINSSSKITVKMDNASYGSNITSAGIIYQFDQYVPKDSLANDIKYYRLIGSCDIDSNKIVQTINSIDDKYFSVPFNVVYSKIQTEMTPIQTYISDVIDFGAFVSPYAKYIEVDFVAHACINVVVIRNRDIINNTDNATAIANNITSNRVHCKKNAKIRLDKNKRIYIEYYCANSNADYQYSAGVTIEMIAYYE